MSPSKNGISYQIGCSDCICASPFLLNTSFFFLLFAGIKSHCKKKKDKWETKREVALWFHPPTSRDWHKIPNVGVQSCRKTETKCHRVTNLRFLFGKVITNTWNDKSRTLQQIWQMNELQSPEVPRKRSTVTQYTQKSMRQMKVQKGCRASRGRWMNTLPATWNREMVRATRFLIMNITIRRTTWRVRQGPVSERNH